MAKIIRVIDYSLEIILIFLMGLMVVDVTWQVISRFVLQAPSSFTEELARFLLIWIGLLGASYAYRKGVHLGIDVLVNRMPEKQRLLTEIAIHLVSTIFAFFIMVVGGFRLVRLTLELHQISAALSIPMGYVYLVLPLSGVLIIYYAALFITNAMRRLQGKTVWYTP